MKSSKSALELERNKSNKNLKIILNNVNGKQKKKNNQNGKITETIERKIKIKFLDGTVKSEKKIIEYKTKIGKKKSEPEDTTKSKSIDLKKNKKKSSLTDQKIDLKKNKKKSSLADHKNDIEKLKDIDPEFYSFLKNNDKELLDFNWDTSDEEDNLESEKVQDNDITHKPPEKLEIASDDDADDEDEHKDDDEDDDDDDEGGSENEDEGSEDLSTEKTTTASSAVTLKLLRKWEKDLQSNCPIETIRNVMLAFNSALASISEDNPNCTYKVEGAAVFNGIIQLCVLHLQEGIHKFLGFNKKKPIHKTKKWSKVRNPLRFYFMDLVRLIEQVSSSNILAVLLKHLHQMSEIVASFPTISKPILKRLIVLWSTAEDSIRVLSFLCILRITRNQQHSLLNHVLKSMYLAYVRNSKFVNPNSLPNINFMRRSLVEMFALDLNIAYQHSFLYIRQLAIHLRNAIVLKKKDSFQSVYNWQYINSIRLWSDLMSVTADKPQLKPLIYPLISITIGVIKLISTAQFFPLRFHCIQTMINLTKQSNNFIPLLPYILEVLNSNTFNKKHTVVSMKPMEFACILRLNKAQLAENGFRDEVIEQVCGLTLQYLENYSSSLAYCDLIVPVVMGFKQYIKTCKNANHSRKIKQILEKITENSIYIENERKKVNFGLKDVQLIKAWEANIYAKQTPLSIYYASWAKTHETKKKRQAARTDDINDYDLPVIKKRKMKQNKTSGPSELFPSDDESDTNIFEQKESETEISEAPKKKKNKKQAEPEPTETNHQAIDEDDDTFNDNAVDIVKDLDIDDW